MATLSSPSTRRTLGIEPREVDLMPIVSQPLTEEESQQISVFFQRKRAENDAMPSVVALREIVARRRRRG